MWDKEWVKKLINLHLGTISVEIQAQHRPDRLKKPRTGSVGTDRLGREPDQLGREERYSARKDIPRGIYFGVSVGALNEH